MERHDLPVALLFLHHGGYDILGLLLRLALRAELASNMNHGDLRSKEPDLGNVQPDLPLAVLPGDRTSALIVEPLVDAGVLLL